MNQSNGPLRATVVIPTYNPGAIFRDVLPKVISQNTDFKFNIVIVDSSSTDGTPEFIREVIKTSPVEIIFYQILTKDFGHGKTRNEAAKKTDSEFVIFITHDATPANNNWLKELVASMDLEENIAGAFGRHLPYPDCNPITARDIVDFMNSFEANPVVWLNDAERYKSDLGYKQGLHFFSDNNSCVRRSVLKQIPYPDVAFAEDQVWAKLIIEAGFKKIFASKAVVYHSHNFSFRENLKRCEDEQLAWSLNFGYDNVKSLKEFVNLTVDFSLDQIKWLKKNHPGFNVKMGLAVVSNNFSRFLGTYNGYKKAKEIKDR